MHHERCYGLHEANGVLCLARRNQCQGIYISASMAEMLCVSISVIGILHTGITAEARSLMRR